MADSSIPRSWEDDFSDQFRAQPAQISADERDQIETRAGGDDDQIERRLALESLTCSGAELIEAISTSRDGGQHRSRIGPYRGLRQAPALSR
jgi:hypothetical protein